MRWCNDGSDPIGGDVRAAGGATVTSAASRRS